MNSYGRDQYDFLVYIPTSIDCTEETGAFPSFITYVVGDLYDSYIACCFILLGQYSNQDHGFSS